MKKRSDERFCVIPYMIFLRLLVVISYYFLPNLLPGFLGGYSPNAGLSFPLDFPPRDDATLGFLGGKSDVPPLLSSVPYVFAFLNAFALLGSLDLAGARSGALRLVPA
jgi:hypothetical protein